ncbi:GSCOCG00010929001-RA-CDS, partial [Cotesia congregata]
MNKQNSDKSTTIDINDSDFNANNTESSVPSGASSIARMIGDSWLKDSHELDDEHKRLSNSYQHEISVDLNNSFDDNKIQRIPDTCHQLSNFNIDCSLSNQVDTKSEVIGTIKTGIVIENSKEDTNYRQNTNESISFEIVPSVDVRNLKILCSKKHKQPKTTKKYFCPYCQTIQTKFARHLELKHRDHQYVQEIVSLKKNTKERRKSIARIRNQGTFMHNMHSDLNTGHLMVARRRQRGKRFKHKTADDYVCCANCQGFYSKATIRLHYVKCDDKHEKGARDILKKCRRKTGYMHPRANEVLRRDVFSVLREGELKNIIAFDELLVLYGNEMCEKCIEVRDHIMIRAELRSLAKHLIVARKIEPKITDYASLLNPKHLKTAVEAVKEVAKWNRKTMRFDVSSNATRLTSSVKKCANKYRSECIRKENQKEKKKADDFIKLWTDEISILLKKTAVRDQ